MNLTGKILDWQDDLEGSVLKKYAAAGQTMKIPKVAAASPVSSPDVVNNLPDDYFGLILMDDAGRRSRRFPLFTHADSVMAAKYFFESGAQALPLKAQVMLAVNIIRMAKRQALADAEMVATEDYAKLKSFLDEHEDIARYYRGGFSNIYDAPQEARTEFNRQSLESQFDRSGGTTIAKANETPCKCDGTGGHVAVTIKTASGSRGMWPLDTADQVGLAVAYFEKNASRIPEKIRREYCLNTMDAADRLGVDVAPGSPVLDYAGTKLAAQWKTAFHDRKRALPSLGLGHETENFDRVITKVASGSMGPDTAVAFLREFDTQFGLDAQYGRLFTAPELGLLERRSVAGSVIEKIGSVSVTAKTLRELAKTPEKLASRLSGEIAAEFNADPVAAFNSSPRVVREIIAGFLQ